MTFIDGSNLMRRQGTGLASPARKISELYVIVWSGWQNGANLPWCFLELEVNPAGFWPPATLFHMAKRLARARWSAAAQPATGRSPRCLAARAGRVVACGRRGCGSPGPEQSPRCEPVAHTSRGCRCHPWWSKALKRNDTPARACCRFPEKKRTDASKWSDRAMQILPIPTHKREPLLLVITCIGTNPTKFYHVSKPTHLHSHSLQAQLKKSFSTRLGLYTCTSSTIQTPYLQAKSFTKHFKTHQTLSRLPQPPQLFWDSETPRLGKSTRPGASASLPRRHKQPRGSRGKTTRREPSSKAWPSK